MKKFTISGLLFIFILSLSVMSCSDDSDENVTPEPEPQPAGEAMLFAIDTARVKTVTLTGVTGTTIVDRMENLNSYISDMSISPDGTKIAYSNYQSVFTPSMAYTREVRVANIDGSGDHVIYTSSDSGVSIGAIRFCSDNKIFYVTQTSFPDLTRTLNVINADGTGNQVLQGQYDIVDVSDDRQYYLINDLATISISIIDVDGDNGAGGLYHNEGIGGESLSEGTFTNDGSKAVIPYKDGNEIKVRIIDMATKTSTTKTLVSGLGSGWISYHLEMGADSNRGVVTLAGSDFPKSKSYVFNLTTGDVSAPFENNDENIFDVYIY